MPLDPKRREIILNGATEAWLIKLRFRCPDRIPSAILARRAGCARVLRDILVAIVANQPSEVAGVENLLLDALDTFADPALDSYEILTADGKAGIAGHMP